tara:strand:- start:367 stop:858 length:492 start_codon:yes stop_codon:yes gene_type:complete
MINEFKNILVNNDFCIAYYSKKNNKEYATLKCKIKQEFPENDEVFDTFIEKINDFYDNKINRELKYKIKFDSQKLGFIGFTNIYNVVKCFRNDKTVLINENILIDTTIIIANSKLKYIFENIFSFLQPSKPIIFKDNTEINNNEHIDVIEKNDIYKSISTIFS